MTYSSNLLGRSLLVGHSTLILQMHSRHCDSRTSNPCDCCIGWGCYDNSRGQVISLDWLKVNTWSEKEITIIITNIYMICRELIVQRRAKIRATASSPTSNLTLGKWSLPPWRPLDGWRVSHWGIIALRDLDLLANRHHLAYGFLFHEKNVCSFLFMQSLKLKTKRTTGIMTTLYPSLSSLRWPR